MDDFLWDRAIELGVVNRRAPGEPAPDTWLLGGLPLPPDGAPGGEDGKGLARSGQAIGLAAADRRSEGGAASWKERKKRKAAQAKARKELQELPVQIEKLESDLAEYDRQLLDPDLASDWEKLFSIQESRRLAADKLEDLFARWEELESLWEQDETP